MRTKSGTSSERTIIYNVFAYIKSIFPYESQRDLLIRTVKATGSIYSCTSVKRIVKENEDTKKAPSPTNKRQGIKQFKKLDDLDLSIIRRTVHSYFSRSESRRPTLEKLLKQLKEDIDFLYGKTNLYNLLKKLGFRYQRRGREGIVDERSDLITRRGSYLKRIKEVREKELQREIVYTDETWLNAGHKVKKEWVDLKASENPRRSIKEFGSVGCTKDNVGKRKRIIIVDCITENGPVLGALWIFSADGQKRK